MDLPPFLLDEWLAQKYAADSPIEYDMGSSTGPVWTLCDLLTLGGADQFDRLLDTRIFYVPPTGTPELREAIARMESVEPQDVQVVTGAAEALWILFFLAAEPDANVVLPSPGFPSNDALATSLGIQTRHYRLSAGNGFSIDVDEVRKLMDRNTRILLVNSPHNPTGGVTSDEEFDTLHDLCTERGIQFVSDQVYHPIYHGPPTRSASRLPKATVIGDFSKALCLSGLRIGWMIDRDPARRARYMTARNYFTITSNVFGERLAALAIQNRDAIYARAATIAARNLALLDRMLESHADKVKWIRPRGGMTAFPWLADGEDTREFCRKLAQRGVLVVPGDCFGEPSHFRVGFAASGDQFPSAIERFDEFLRSAHSHAAG